MKNIKHFESYDVPELSNDKNRIKQLDLNDLLVYNGLDSLLEYKVAEMQMNTLRRRNETRN